MADEKLERAEITIRKRVECEERAFHIVNKLVDGCVDGPYLTECGKRISPAHYDDIVEERAITKLCGYPLCDQGLPNVPKKKYHISTKTNKVYDISERKKFCSNQCFKASNIFKQQIPESPVWTRKEGKIKIAISPHKGVPGLVGDEVIGERPKDVLEKEVETLEELDKRFEKKNKNDRGKSDLKRNFNESDITQHEDQDSTNNNDDDDASFSCPVPAKSSKCVDELVEPIIVDNLHSDLEKLHLDKSEPGQMESPKPCTSKVREEKQSQPSSKMEQLQMLLNKRKNVLSGMVDLQDTAKCNTTKGDQNRCGHSSDKTTNEKSQNLEKLSKRVEKPLEHKAVPSTAVESPLHSICQVLKKWMSIATVEFLHFKSSNLESVDPVAKKFSDLQIQVDCVNLAKNLDVQEKQFESLVGDDANGVGLDDDAAQKGRKSVPEYQALKDEAEQFQLKVTEFVTGKRPKQNSKEKDDATEEAVYIPTVDAYDQSQIRAKIVLERLDKFLPDVLVPMGLSVQDVSTHLRELVYTLRLEKDTIVFKPAEWTLVSLLLLKMLSFRVKAVQEAFSKESTVRHFTILLKRIKNTVDDLDVCTRDILSEATVAFKPR